MKKDISLLCNCGCGSGLQIIFRIDNDKDYAYITTLTSNFYAGQRGIWEMIWHRIKAAWFMLCGKEYYLHDVVLSKEQWNEFVKTVNEVV